MAKGIFTLTYKLIIAVLGTTPVLVSSKFPRLPQCLREQQTEEDNTKFQWDTASEMGSPALSELLLSDLEAPKEPLTWDSCCH